MNTSYLFGEPKPMILWRRLLWVWAAFWLMMLALGIQESLWTGTLQIRRPLVNTGSSALAATLLIAAHIRRADWRDSLLNQPVRWFIRSWASMPLQMIAYIAAMYGLRFGIYELGGARYQHGPWVEVLAYEATSFTMFYALFSGILFGARSYRAWIEERLTAEKQADLARQAQLAQLTQQLQPHFLFNALNTVSSLIHTQPDAADLLLSRLATLLRAATDASRCPEQSLADELTLLRAYAEIMTQRFSDRVRISWEVDVTAHDCLVPTLGLQPLLENCFRHVVEQRSALTHIAIRVKHSADRLQIEVEDDGDLQSLPKRRGVGLGNLERRLESLFGGQASLELRLRRGSGLIVGVHLPCVR